MRRLPPMCNRRYRWPVSVETEGEPQKVGELIRFWRTQRHLTQMELGLDANLSTKHLSFVETGRSRPSRQLLVHLDLRTPLGEVSLFTVIATLGAPLEVTAADGRAQRRAARRSHPRESTHRVWLRDPSARSSELLSQIPGRPRRRRRLRSSGIGTPIRDCSR